MSNKQQELLARTAVRAKLGWQCPECSSVNVTRQESKYGGVSEDRFSCQECGCQWGRK